LGGQNPPKHPLSSHKFVSPNSDCIGIRGSVLQVAVVALITFAVLYPTSNGLGLNYPGEGTH
jgi:hypothetical protein